MVTTAINSSVSMLRAMSELFRIVPPSEWNVSHRVVLDRCDINLLDCSGEGSPVFFIPPNAGHKSTIAEMVVKIALQQRRHVYCIDHKSATYERRNETIDNYIDATHACLKKIGEPVTLVGLCQGGWQAAIYTALYPENVRELIIAGSPIDTQAGDGFIKQSCNLLPMSYFETLVKMGNGNMPGRFMLNSFKLMNCVDRYVGDSIDLFEIIAKDDAEGLERNRKHRSWYEPGFLLDFFDVLDTPGLLNIPGKAYLQIVKQLFMDNDLINGLLVVQGRRVDLKDITCPVKLLGGTEDDITPPEQVFNAQYYLGTKDVEKLLVPGGHIGIYTSKKNIPVWERLLKESPEEKLDRMFNRMWL